MRFSGDLVIFLLLAWLAPRDVLMERRRDEVFRGKFTGHTGARCRWTARGDTRLTLKVTCGRGGPSCGFTGEPALCPSYSATPRAFWKQVSRALQLQGQHLCTSSGQVVAARSCRNGPRAAHFRLATPKNTVAMTTARARPAEDTLSTECTRRADHRELAQEKCGGTWADLCNFFFHMVQSRDC